MWGLLIVKRSQPLRFPPLLQPFLGIAGQPRPPGGLISAHIVSRVTQEAHGVACGASRIRV